MGGSSSYAIDEKMRVLIDEQLEEIKTSKIHPIAYQIFLSNFSNVVVYPGFYQLQISMQQTFFDQVGPITVKEAKTVVQRIVELTKCKEDAQKLILALLPHMILETSIKKTKYYITPALDEDVFDEIMDTKYKNEVWGKFKLSSSVYDWKSDELKKQKADYLTNKQKFVHHVVHVPEFEKVLLENNVRKIWTLNVPGISKPFNEEPSKPIMIWKKNVHEAAEDGDEKSLAYDLYCCPYLINLPNDINDTPAHSAAKGGRNDTLTLLFNLGALFDRPNNEGNFPIHCCTSENAIKAFASFNYDLTTRNPSGLSILDINTQNFNKKMIKAILANGYDITKPNLNGTFWLQEAINKRYFDLGKMELEDFVKLVRQTLQKNKTAPYLQDIVVQDILSRDNKNHDEIDLKDFNESVDKRDLHRMQVLLAFGVNGDIPREHEECPKTNLFMCAEYGHTEECAMLTRNYCNPNFTNALGQNTFWVATLARYYQTALVLRDGGADMNALCKQGYTILHEAYETNTNDIFQFLLDAGASPNVRNSNGQSVIFLAFLKRDDAVGEMLQEKYNGDINTQDGNGATLAHVALFQKDLQRIAYLVSRGINLEVKNNMGHSVFMQAFTTDINFQTWDFLLQNGSDINTFDSQGNTPLILSLSAPPQTPVNDEVFQYLINHQCDINKPNFLKQLPLSVALINCHDEYANKLIGMKCLILYPDSQYEPICVALQRNSQQWFEYLVQLGADASNTVYPVVANYILSPFFNFQIFSTLRNMNLFIGGTLQAAFVRRYDQVASFIWNMCDDNGKITLSRIKDPNGMIPLSAAIVAQIPQFVDILINKLYDLMTPDNNGITPLMHSIVSKNNNWIYGIYNLTDLKYAEQLDSLGNSALTYAGENENSDFCEKLFIDGVDVYNCKKDSKGYVAAYRDLIEDYKDMVKQATENAEFASKLRQRAKNDKEQIKRAKENLESEIRSIHSDISRERMGQEVNQSRIRDLEHREREVRGRLDETQRRYEGAKAFHKKTKQIEKKYEKRLDDLKRATRYDILYRTDFLAHLAYDDGDIGRISRAFALRAQTRSGLTVLSNHRGPHGHRGPPPPPHGPHPLR